MPTGCPEPRPSGTTGVHAVQLGAVRPRGSTDMAVRSEGPVVTGLEAIRCTRRACGAVVSERGLEPPRATSPLGPQPRSTGERPTASVHLQARPDAVTTRGATSENGPEVSEVPEEVPPIRSEAGCCGDELLRSSINVGGPADYPPNTYRNLATLPHVVARQLSCIRVPLAQGLDWRHDGQKEVAGSRSSRRRDGCIRQEGIPSKGRRARGTAGTHI